MTFTASTYQAAIFDFAANGKGNLIIGAVAGSGKTTTIVELTKHLSGSVIFLAFNKSIATELGSRGVPARTFHSLCFSPVLKLTGQKSVVTDKLTRLARVAFDSRELALYGAGAQKLVGLARNSLSTDWAELAARHDIEAEDYVELYDCAGRLFRACEAADSCDFDDLLYRAVTRNVGLPKYNWVLVDEAQDTNAIQRALLKSLLTPLSRLIAVGDPAQAIYGFRGADTEAFGLIRSEFSCAELPLSVSYRCAQAVVKKAQQYVSHILPHESAPEGSVITDSPFAPRIGDLVVCRNTAPLIQAAYELIGSKVAVKVLGRDIGAGLVSLVNKLNAKGVDALLTKLDAWQEREQDKAKEEKKQAIEDKAESLRTVIASLLETNRTVPAVIASIEALFNGDGPCVTLATIHKAKGLEADTVWWHRADLLPSKWAKQEWQLQQEMHLCYVAVTRAKKQLYIC